MNTIVPTWDKGGETTKVLVKTIIFFFLIFFLNHELLCHSEKKGKPYRNKPYHCKVADAGRN